MLQSKKQLYIWLGIAGFALLCYALQPVLTPFLISALIAYASNPLVERLQRYCSRTWAITFVFVLVALLVLIFLLIVIPVAGRQLLYLYELTPRFIGWMQEHILPWLQETLVLDEDVWQADKIKAMLLVHIDKAPDLANVLVVKLGNSSAVLFSWLADLVLVVLATYYLLVDWPRLSQYVQSLVPRRYSAYSQQLTKECHEVLGSFVHGQLLVMLTLGLIYTVGMMLVGLELALIIGIVATLASLVPTLGFMLGLVLALLATLLQFGLDYFALGAVAAVFIVGRTLENLFLTQALVGDRLGLHPLTVMFALLAGSHLMGLSGALLALPVAAILMVVSRDMHRNYKQSSFYATPSSVEEGESKNNTENQ